jgi:minor extracellular serine protease Vpr
MLNKKLSRSLVFLVTLALVLSSFSLGALADSKNNTENVSATKMAELFGNIDLSTSQQTTVIVELIEESIVEAKHKGKKQNKSMLASERNRVVQELQDKVGSTKVNREYDYVFSGFSALRSTGWVSEI